MKQISPITVHNPKNRDEEETTWGQCNCCGEDCKSHGMCLSCVQADCHSDFTEPCSRTGETDPLGKSVKMLGVE